MLDIINLSVQFSGDNLFEKVNLRINKNDKIALVGANGTGKSTLLKLIFGAEQPETGETSKQKNLMIGFLPQEFVHLKGKSLFSEVKSSLTDVTSILTKEDKLTNELSDPATTEERKEEIITALGTLSHQKEGMDFYAIDSEIEKVLVGLGFTESDFHKFTEEFSGGWQMRIELAKILLGNNNLILLDEPTNHLDIDSLSWIVEYLKNFNGALVIVSHDRYFINSVTNKTLEIANRQVTFYNGDYNSYLKYKEEKNEQLRASYKNQQRKIKEVERFIERFRYKNTKASQVQSRVKQLEKLDLISFEETERNIEVKFPDPPRSGSIPIKIERISKSYGDNHVLEKVEFSIERGEKIALVGPNGAGKTTLANLIAGKLSPDEGRIEIGHNTSISFYAQEVADNLDMDKNVIEAVSNISDDFTPLHLRSVLGSFLFSDEDVFKKVKVLSGGEKSRVALTRILLTKANVVVLDEPTNHLDHFSKQALQNALINFQGTLIIIAHDIDFLRPIVNKVYEVRDRGIKPYYGGIDYYLQKRKEFIEHEKFIQSEINEPGKVTRKGQKRFEAEQRQKKFQLTKDLKKKISNLENEIEKGETQKELLEKDLAKEEIFSNPNLAKEKNMAYEEVKLRLENLYAAWTESSHELESIEESFSDSSAE